MRMSLRKKTTVIVILITMIISIISVFVSFRLYTSTMDTYYIGNITRLAKTVAERIDGDQIEYYLSDEGVADDRYYEILEELINFRDDIGMDCINIVQNKGSFSYNVMDTDEDGSILKTKNINAEEFSAYMYQGQVSIPATISNSEYGWWCSGYEPIYNSKGEGVALVGVEFAMDGIINQRHQFLFGIIGALVGVMLIIILLVVKIIDSKVVKPINLLSKVTSKYVESRDGDTSLLLESLNINTGDEIEELLNSFKKMEQEMNIYIKNLTTFTAEKERISTELEVATMIQVGILPSKFPEKKEYSLYATMNPAKEVGGDFYDFFQIDDNRMAIVIADVSGKGVPAALFMMQSMALIRNYAQMTGNPSQALTLANEKLCENNKAEMFVTAFIAVVELDTGKFIYANAGHNKPLISRGKGEFDWLSTKPGFVLAGMEGIKYKAYEDCFEEGDVIYLYTDGVTEALNKNEKLYGDSKLKELLNKEDVKNFSMQRLLEFVRDDLAEFAEGTEQADDITMLGFRFNKKLIFNEIVIAANLNNLEAVINFVDRKLKEVSFSSKAIMQVDIAVEEVFSNITHYAYGENRGDVKISFEYFEEEKAAKFIFMDKGMAYNPLKLKNESGRFTIEESNLDDLGGYVAKKIMDNIDYEYRDNQNILTIIKSN